jgi:hypothetical protein
VCVNLKGLVVIDEENVIAPLAVYQIVAGDSKD